MRKIILWSVGLGGLLAAVIACTRVIDRTTCFNPTGYCGQSDLKSDRVGGPVWFLWEATPPERMNYYRERCLEAEQPLSPDASTTCALEGIKSDAHHHCVLYYLPPIRPKNDAEKAERQRSFQECKQKILDQHSL